MHVYRGNYGFYSKPWVMRILFIMRRACFWLFSSVRVGHAGAGAGGAGLLA